VVIKRAVRAAARKTWAVDAPERREVSISFGSGDRDVPEDESTGDLLDGAERAACSARRRVAAEQATREMDARLSPAARTVLTAWKSPEFAVALRNTGERRGAEAVARHVGIDIQGARRALGEIKAARPNRVAANRTWARRHVRELRRAAGGGR
jgi:hypothetical protein